MGMITPNQGHILSPLLPMAEDVFLEILNVVKFD